MQVRFLHILANHSAEDAPKEFNCPYYYEPHALCVEAIAAVRDGLAGQSDWHDEIAKGKMFGVLVVMDDEGRVGYLKAYSGQIGGRSDWDGWVPAVFDYLQPDGYFCTEEGEISGLNRRIAELKSSAEVAEYERRLAEVKASVSHQLTAFREMMAESKARREALRTSGMADETALVAESQFQKAELKRLKHRCDEAIRAAEAPLQALRDEISRLKSERQQRSEALQRWLFSKFVMLNGKGEERPLLDIFAPTAQRIPPSGAGECCAPKLLQAAYSQGLKPLAMAEFWWGESPVGEVRRHLQCYPACQGKCRPILDFMLQGLNVARNPLEESESVERLSVIYEDEWLIAVDKPAGMLAAPGRGERASAIEVLQNQRPDIGQLYNVHRLDMATSGILLMAKSADSQRCMQAMFARRETHKEYCAVVDGLVERQDGVIDLPLSADYINRPRQKVDHAGGKEALTRFERVAIEGPFTRLRLFPLTGRTHQLRMHCAHKEGLGTPIVGDELYGRRGKRMLLHAGRLTFEHPYTHEHVEVKAPCPF